MRRNARSTTHSKQAGTRPNDLCPCGGGRKWKACHDPDSARASASRYDVEIDTSVNTLLEVLCGNVIDLLSDVLSSTQLPGEGEDSARAARATLAFLGVKTYRNMKAVLLLVTRGQSLEGFSLLRELYEYWIAATYYDEFTDDALRFVASEVLRRRDDALRIMKFDPSMRDDPGRQVQFRELMRECEEAYREVPGLRVPRGKSGLTPKPEMRDWEPPTTDNMLRALKKKWNDQQRTKKNADELEREVLSTQFFMSSWLSQEKHATQTVLSLNLKLDANGMSGAVETRYEDPNLILRLAIQRGFIVAHTLKKRIDKKFEHQFSTINAAINYHESPSHR